MSLRLTLLLVFLSRASLAAEPADTTEWSRWGSWVRTPAFEVNVLWPFFPGGIVDLKALVPVLRVSDDRWRGELVLALHSDFAWRVVREGAYGKVSILGAKVGYRQFFAYGLHLDVTVDVGWRQEKDNPYDGTTINGLTARLWPFVGWQIDLTPRVYLNLRGGPGIHLFRTGPYADKERLLSGGADLNLGVRL